MSDNVIACFYPTQITSRKDFYDLGLVDGKIICKSFDKKPDSKARSVDFDSIKELRLDRLFIKHDQGGLIRGPEVHLIEKGKGGDFFTAKYERSDAARMTDFLDAVHRAMAATQDSARDSAPAANPGAAPPSGMAAQLRELADLHSQGVLTDAEFSEAKKSVLGGAGR